MEGTGEHWIAYQDDGANILDGLIFLPTRSAAELSTSEMN